jgi:hypothetical protein
MVRLVRADWFIWSWSADRGDRASGAKPVMRDFGLRAGAAPGRSRRHGLARWETAGRRMVRGWSACGTPWSGEGAWSGMFPGTVRIIYASSS